MSFYTIAIEGLPGMLLNVDDPIGNFKRKRYPTAFEAYYEQHLVTLEALENGYQQVIDKEQYLALAKKIQEAIPDISLTTDIIVGFPGETEEDFLETMDVVGKVGYDSAFTFIYSKRSGTPAAAKEDQVPEEVVKDRFDRLLAQVQEIARERSSRFEGTVQEVLVESVNYQDASLVTGRLVNYLQVHFPGDASMIGTFKQIHLDVCKGFYYMGTPAE